MSANRHTSRRVSSLAVKVWAGDIKPTEAQIKTLAAAVIIYTSDADIVRPSLKRSARRVLAAPRKRRNGKHTAHGAVH
jgi:hypothetical protein